MFTAVTITAFCLVPSWPAKDILVAVTMLAVLQLATSWPNKRLYQLVVLLVAVDELLFAAGGNWVGYVDVVIGLLVLARINRGDDGSGGIRFRLPRRAREKQLAVAVR
jgi:hypothetical protein